MPVLVFLNLTTFFKELFDLTTVIYNSQSLNFTNFLYLMFKRGSIVRDGFVLTNKNLR